MLTKKIGNKIAEARKKTQISQAELAQRLFISPQAVGKWERGESMPDITTFGRLAEILGVDLNYFSESFSSETIEITNDQYLNETSDQQTTSKINPNNKGTRKKLNWNMSFGNWVDADFSGLKDLQEKLRCSNMKNCKFIDSNMSGLILRSNHMESCDFRGSDLRNSQMKYSHLENNLFNDCSLQDAEISLCDIKGCDFSGANFTGAKFKTSDFAKNNMANAVLNSTSFISMSMKDVVFEGAIEDCYFENCSFKKVTFQNSVFTNTFFKSNLKGIAFINCETDRMTYEFLKNGKADLTGITLLAPLGID
jgi:uncharacterized protein YjbI with pentapeptide repeats/DNA-binding XRE family transcriptional regulator